MYVMLSVIFAKIILCSGGGSEGGRRRRLMSSVGCGLLKIQFGKLQRNK